MQVIGWIYKYIEEPSFWSFYSWSNRNKNLINYLIKTQNNIEIYEVFLGQKIETPYVTNTKTEES